MLHGTDELRRHPRILSGLIERVEDLCAETLLKLGVTRNDGTPSGPSPYGARTLLSTSVI